MRAMLQPIVYCGYGTNLYPLCDAAAATGDSDEEGTSSGSKALLPVGNRPLLAWALQHVLTSGLKQAIVLAPASQHADIKQALARVELGVPTRAATSDRKQKASVKQNARITFDDATTASSSSDLAMHVTLLPLGPHDGPSSSKEHIEDFRDARLGTAELLRWVAKLGLLRHADPLVLPVDLVGPAFALRDVIDVYITAQATQLEAPTACCALYERGAGGGLGKERDKEGPSRLIAALSEEREGKPARVAFLRDSDLDASDLEIRQSLLQASPRLRISTRLLDAHVYIFNRRHILPLLEGNHKLTSLRDHVVPLIAKASWQRGLQKKAGWAFEGEDDKQTLASSALHREAIRRNNHFSRREEDKSNPIQCFAHVVQMQAQEGSDEGQRFFARANTLATYMGSNRWLLRTQELQEDEGSGDYITPAISADAAQTGVSGSAQVAADCLIAPGATVGDRATIKATTISERCDVARGAKLSGCILLPGSKVEENARLEGCIVCSGAVVGARSVLVDCDVAPSVRLAAETSAKNEKLVGEDDDSEEGGDL